MLPPPPTLFLAAQERNSKPAQTTQANRQFFYPMMHWERPYRGDICTELNIERYSLHKDGTIGYHHPTSTHNDAFWATALAVYATTNTQPKHNPKPISPKKHNPPNKP